MLRQGRHLRHPRWVWWVHAVGVWWVHAARWVWRWVHGDRCALGVCSVRLTVARARYPLGVRWGITGSSGVPRWGITSSSGVPGWGITSPSSPSRESWSAVRKMVGRIDRGRSRRGYPARRFIIYIYIPLIWS
jgi:hypothetical protein